MYRTQKRIHVTLFLTTCFIVSFNNYSVDWFSFDQIGQGCHDFEHFPLRFVIKIFFFFQHDKLAIRQRRFN